MPVRRSTSVGSSAHAVEVRALAAPRDPLLLGPEVVHEAEDDVGHRRPVGDRDRERVVRRGRAWRSATRRSGRSRPARSGSPKSTTPRSSLTAVNRAPASCSASSSAKTTSSAAASITQRPVAALAARARLVTRSAIVGLAGEHRRGSRRPTAGTRPASRVRQRRVGGHPGLSYGGACRADLRPARGRRARRRPAARARRRRHRQDDRRSSSASRGSPSAPSPESVLALTLGDGAADRLRERVEDRMTGALRGAAVTTFPGFCAPPAARRGARGGPRPVRHAGRRAPTGWRCCSSTSTTCRCATTTCAATRARCSARSSAASTASRTS